MAGNTKKTLVEALAAFQADLPRVELDAVNPHFKSKYASLGSVTKAVLPKLTEHGFAFTVGSFVDNGLLVLDAHLVHESGESRSAQFPITETNPQKVGSSISYYRRYALSALTGIVADEDDDGNAASQPTATGRQLDKARNSAPAPTPPATGQSELDKLNARIRKYIGTPQDETKKNAVNSLLGSDELKGKSPVEQRKAVVTQLGIPE